jgi:hypothetical protein
MNADKRKRIMADIAIRQDPQLLELNPPLVQGQPHLHDLTEKICGIVEGDVIKTPLKYWITLGVTASITGVLLLMLGYLVATGIGVWGNNRPIGWAWDITNFVFWIGIGHAGTLISAILFLFRQKWRTSINRSAEAMTLFAVMCAAIFPLFHTGRPWRAFYWLFPIPNTDITMWQNFRSPLIWDVFAVSTYLTGFDSVLVHRTDSGRGDAARSRHQESEAGGVRDPEPGLARFGAALEQLRGGVPDPGRSFDAAGIKRPLSGELRLCHVGHSRLAHHNFSALLRRWRYLLRIRVRDDAADHRALDAESPRADHHQAPGEHEQDHPGDRIDRGLRIRNRAVHGLVQRQHL